MRGLLMIEPLYHQVVKGNKTIYSFKYLKDYGHDK